MVQYLHAEAEAPSTNSANFDSKANAAVTHCETNLVDGQLS